MFVRGCEKFVIALAYLFCLTLPESCLARFTYSLAGLCILAFKNLALPGSILNCKERKPMIRLDTYPCHAIFLCVSPTTFACRTIDGLRPSVARVPAASASASVRRSVEGISYASLPQFSPKAANRRTDGRTRTAREGGTGREGGTAMIHP